MLRRISLAQLLEWIAFYELEPFGELRQDFRMAHTMALMANLNRNHEKQPEPFKLSQFMLKFDGELPAPPPQKDWRDMKAAAVLWAAVYSKEGKR